MLLMGEVVMSEKPIIIIGTGLAGYNLAKELRKIDHNIKLQLFTTDNGNYYSKPMLSNAFTQGKAASELVIADAEKMRQQLKADIFTETEVNGIDMQQQYIIANNQCYPYSKLVFACGASQIRP